MRCRFPTRPPLVALFPSFLPAAGSSQTCWGHQSPRIGRNFRERSPVNRRAKPSSDSSPRPPTKAGSHAVAPEDGRHPARKSGGFLGFGCFTRRGRGSRTGSFSDGVGGPCAAENLGFCPLIEWQNRKNRVSTARSQV